MEREILLSLIEKIFYDKKINNDFLLDLPNLDIFVSQAIKKNNLDFLKKAKEKNYIFNIEDLFLALDCYSISCFGFISKDIKINEEIIKEICKRNDASNFISLLIREEKIDPYSDTYEEIFYQNNLFELSLFLLDYNKESLLKRFLKEKKDLFLSHIEFRVKEDYDENFTNFLKYLFKKNKRTLLNEVLKIWKEEDDETLKISLNHIFSYVNENNLFMLKDLINYLYQ